MATIRDEAVCVRIWDWSETSQTVSLLTREHGLIRGLAKGAKRDQGTFSGGFELATQGELVAILKRDGRLATLTAWDLRDPFRALRGDLSAFYGGCAITEVAHAAVTDHDPHPLLYDALVSALRACDKDPVRATVAFVWRMLVETGYRPLLDSGGAEAGGTRGAGGVVGFEPRTGAITPDPGVGRGSSVWRVRGETVDRLRAMAESEGDCAPAREDPGASRVLKLLAAYACEVLGRELSAVTLLVERSATSG